MRVHRSSKEQRRTILAEHLLVNGGDLVNQGYALVHCHEQPALFEFPQKRLEVRVPPYL